MPKKIMKGKTIDRDDGDDHDGYQMMNPVVTSHDYHGLILLPASAQRLPSQGGLLHTVWALILGVLKMRILLFRVVY